jgi:hypothetical protein
VDIVFSYVLPFVLGLVTAVFNVVGGGGSLLTIPGLVEMGMTAQAANATNRIGVILQAVTSTTTLARRRQIPVKLSLVLSAAAIPGAILGAFLATTLDDAPFRLVLSGLFALMGLNLLYSLWSTRKNEDTTTEDPEPGWKLVVAFFLVGIYGGFIQAGVGIVMLLVFQNLTAIDLRRANGVKVAVVLLFTTISLSTFLVMDASLIHWREGFIIGSGALVGGWLGARYNEVIPVRAVKWVLVVAVFASSMRFAGVI